MNMNYKNLLLNDEWNYITPNDNSIYKINTFDDGNQNYKQYINEWILFGIWKGKFALFNKVNNTIIIKSISKWKVTKIINI